MTQRASRHEPEVVAALSRPHVLLIGDDDVNLTLLKAQLAASDYELQVAASAFQGLAAARARPPDLILLDAIMAGIDGFEVVRRLKSSESTRGVPVLLITSQQARREKLHGLMAGADDFLTRPIDTSELIARVRSLLRTKMLYDQLLILNGNVQRQPSRQSVELATASQELKAFTDSVSHDLRAPLRGIAGLSERLIDDYSDRLDSTATMYLIRIQLASQRMDQMLDDLIMLSGLAPAELRCESVDLSQEASAIIGELHRLEPRRDVRTTIAPGLTVIGDAGLLRIVLQNLLENAWKFTATRRRGTIEFGIAQPEGVTAYFVRDNGVGFDVALASKLFTVFQRLHDPSEFEGRGVGLASVQRIIQRHGGRVWAESVSGEGSTFWFTLAT